MDAELESSETKLRDTFDALHLGKPFKKFQYKWFENIISILLDPNFIFFYIFQTFLPLKFESEQDDYNGIN